MRTISAILAILALTGCEAVGKLDQGLRNFEGKSAQILNSDTNTTYSVEDRADGFILSVSHAELQNPTPEATQKVLLGCRRALDEAAVKVAQERGRFIARIDDRLIQSSTSRIALVGRTSCKMTAPVSYVQ